MADWIVVIAFAISGYAIGVHNVYRWYLKEKKEFDYEKEKLKEDYNAKVEALEHLLEQMNKPIAEEDKYKTLDFFAPGTDPVYGLPRKL